MKNLKVRLKLTIGFAIITGLLIIVGVIGAIGMSSLNKADVKMYDVNVTAMDALGSIRENYAQQRATYRNFIIYDPGSTYYQSSLKSMSALEADMEAYIATYDGLIEKREERDSFNNFLTNYRGGFKSFKEELLAFGAQNQNDKAMEILSSDSILQLSNSINANLNECYELNVAYSKEAVDGNSALADKATLILLIVIAVALVLAIFLTVYISGLICTPLMHMSSFLEKVQTTGDLTFGQEDQDTLPEDMKLKDEIGRCVAACASLVYRILDVKENLTKLSEGDLTTEMELLSDSDSIGIAFNHMIKRLNNMFTEIRGASNQVSNGSQQIAQGAQALASGSSQQSSSIEEFSASLLELQEKTKETADNSIKSQELAHQSETMIAESIRHMGEMLIAMKAIDDSSKSITKVIKVIDDIAFQTNILALNAAVEAARAGQHGKGFAVVADEVRNLASKSSDAAKETAALIDGSVERVKEGNQIVERTNASLGAVVSGAKEAAVLLQNVAAASTEQAKAIHEMNQSLEQISSVVQENSASAQQSAASSEEMSAQAAVLSEIVASFKLRESRKGTGHGADKPASFSGIALKKDGIL